MNSFISSAMDETVLIYYAFSLDVAQSHMNRAPNETRTYSYSFVCLVCQQLHH